MNPDWQLVLLDCHTLPMWCNWRRAIPGIGKKKISRPAASDVIRLALLKQFGGVWADATLFCAKPMKEWLPDSPFFAFQNSDPRRTISSWFLAADHDSKILNQWHASAIDYWRKHDQADHYYWVHHLFTRLMKDNLELREQWRQSPQISNIEPHFFHYYGFQGPVDSKVKEQLESSRSPVYKLTWKKPGIESTPRLRALFDYHFHQRPVVIGPHQHDELLNGAPQKHRPVLAKRRAHVRHHPNASAKVSVIVTCHDYGRFLAECLESILAQTLPAGEILVVLDDCPDDSPLIADKFRGRGVRCVQHRARSLYLSKRLGLKKTTGKYVLFMDADDVMTPTYLERLMKVMERPRPPGAPKLGVVTGYVRQFGYTVYPEGDPRLVWAPDPAKIDIEQNNCLIGPSLVLREAVESIACVGGQGLEDLTQTNNMRQDYEIWRGIHQAGYAFDKANAEFLYRRHESNLTLQRPGAWGDRHRAAVVAALRAAGPLSPPKEPLKALFVTPSLAAGGVATRFKWLVNNNQKQNIQWVGTVLGDKGGADRGVVDWIRSRMPVMGSQQPCYLAHMNPDNLDRKATAFDAIDALLATTDVDVVYCWGNTSMYAEYLLRKQPEIAVVFGVHGQCQWTQKFAALCAPYATRFICVSETATRVAPQEHPEQIRIVELGTDVGELGRSLVSRSTLRTQWGVPPQDFAIGFVGRWSPEKNPLIVPAAVAELRRRGHAGMHFVACGPQCELGADGIPQTVPADQRDRSEALAGPVIWTNATDSSPWSLGDVYRALDVLVISSHGEGIPHVLCEALACGCSVVMTPVGAGPEVDRRQPEIAVFVPLNPTPEQLADGIAEALGPHHQSRRDSNRDWVLSNSSAKGMAAAWEAIMEEAVMERRAQRADRREWAVDRDQEFNIPIP